MMNSRLHWKAGLCAKFQHVGALVRSSVAVDADGKAVLQREVLAVFR